MKYYCSERCQDCDWTEVKWRKEEECFTQGTEQTEGETMGENLKEKDVGIGGEQRKQRGWSDGWMDEGEESQQLRDPAAPVMDELELRCDGATKLNHWADSNERETRLSLSSLSSLFSPLLSSLPSWMSPTLSVCLSSPFSLIYHQLLESRGGLHWVTLYTTECGICVKYFWLINIKKSRIKKFNKKKTDKKHRCFPIMFIFIYWENIWTNLHPSQKKKYIFIKLFNLI